MNINASNARLNDPIAIAQRLAHANKCAADTNERAAASSSTRPVDRCGAAAHALENVACERPVRPSAMGEAAACDKPATPPTSSTASGPYTSNDLAHLLVDWGQGGSPSDLDGNGTVDVDDLIAMILNWSGPASTPPTAPQPVPDEKRPVDPILRSATNVTLSAVAPERPESIDKPPDPRPSPDAPATGPYTSNDLAHLIVNWGQGGTSSDLDGNGTVDVDDLIAMILNWSGPSSVPSDSTPRPHKPLEVRPSLVDIEKPLFAQPVTDRPGDIEKPNFDPKPRRRRAEARAELALGAQDLKPHRPALESGQLKNLSASLLDRLTAAGFKDRPPANIRALIERLDLAPQDQQRVMSAVQDRYPRGLGVNLSA